MKKQLWNRIETIKQIESANTFINFLATAPILKRFFHSDLSGEYEAKEGIALAVRTLNYLTAVLYKAIYVVVLYALVEVLSEGNYDAFGHVFFFMTLIGASLKEIISYTNEDHLFTRILRIDAKEYVFYNIDFYLIKEFRLFTLLFLVLAKATDLSIYSLLLYLFMYLGMHMTSTYIRFHFIKKNSYLLGNVNKKSISTIISIIVISLAAIVVVRFPGIYIHAKIMYVIAGLCTALGIYSYIQLRKIDYYDTIFKRNLTVEKLADKAVAVSGGQFSFIDLAAMSKAMEITEIDSKYKGYRYIHEAFKSRYKKTLKRGRLITFIIILVLGLSGLILPFFFDGRYDVGPFIYEQLRMLFYIVFLFSTSSKNYVIACFMQVDRYLINYHFFRRASDISKNFKLRLKDVFINTYKPTSLTMIFLVLIYIFHSKVIDYSHILIIIVLSTVLAIFYSCFSLSAYYLFQPYSNDGKIVNKAYSFIDYLVYMIPFVLFQTEITVSLLTLIIISVVLVVISFGLYVSVLKVAPKKFRVR